MVSGRRGRIPWVRVTRRTTRTILVLSKPIAVSKISSRACRHSGGRRHGFLPRVCPILIFLSPKHLSLSSLGLPFFFLLRHPSFIFGTSLLPILTLRNALKLVKLLFFTIKCVAFLIIGTRTEGTGHSCNFNLFCSSHAMCICWFE